MKKYELTKDKFITHNIVCGVSRYTKYEYTLRRIRALVDIPAIGVKSGDFGGYIESEDNLSHEGDCWCFSYQSECILNKIYGELYKLIGRPFYKKRGTESSMVYGCSVVYGDAIILPSAIVECASIVGDSSIVCNGAVVSAFAIVRGESKIMPNQFALGKSGTNNIF